MGPVTAVGEARRATNDVALRGFLRRRRPQHVGGRRARLALHIVRRRTRHCLHGGLFMGDKTGEQRVITEEPIRVGGHPESWEASPGRECADPSG